MATAIATGGIYSYASDRETLKGMMQDAGFENVDYYNLTAGIVALHRGYKF